MTQTADTNKPFYTTAVVEMLTELIAATEASPEHTSDEPALVPELKDLLAFMTRPGNQNEHVGVILMFLSWLVATDPDSAEVFNASVKRIRISLLREMLTEQDVPQV